MPQTTDPAPATPDESTEHDDMAAAPATNGADSDDPIASVVPVTTLLEEEATIPFVGLTPAIGGDYPNPVSTDGTRFNTTDPLSFKEAIQCLPKAGEGTLWAANEFAEPNGEGGVEVDVEAIHNVHGLDTEQVEAVSGRSLNQLATDADPDPLLQVGDHKDIIDRRRLALRTLGYDVKFRWQIATDTYDPGDMHTFLQRKIAAAQKFGADQPFGWIRHYDWGGAAVIATIYPSLDYEVGLPDADDLAIDAGGEAKADTLAEAPVEQAVEAADGDSETECLTIYYGERMGYDFRGTQTIWAYPLIYVPDVDVMIPLPGPRFRRRHVGDVMDDTHERDNDRVPLIEWHESILTRLETLATQVNQDVIRARMVAIAFDDLPFEVTAFYEYLGIPTDYAEQAADRATSLADPSSQPTLWNLQLSLKLALLDHYQGAWASDTYQEYQELAGQILRYPAQQIQLALEAFEREQEAADDTDDPVLPEDQQTLAESLDDVVDLPGVHTEDSVSPAEAQQIEERVQQRFSDLS